MQDKSPGILAHPYRKPPLTTRTPGDRLTSALVTFSGLWNYPVLKRTWARWCLLIVVALIGLARARIGLAGTQMFSHDAFMLLDGGWRMLNGQRPHVDFYTHLGVLAYAPTAFCLWISGARAQAFGYAQGLTAVIVGVWAYFIGRNRLRDMPLALMCVMVALMVADPSALGFSPFRVGPAMTYNRCGYAVLAVLLIEALFATKSNRARGDLLGGISTGAVLASLLFLKVTYFTAAIFLLAALWLCRTQTRRRWIGIAVGFCGLFVLFDAYFHFDLRPMWNDLVMVAGAKHFTFATGRGRPSFSWYMIGDILQDALVVLAFAMASALLLLARNRPRTARRFAIAAVVLCIAGILLLFGNYEQNGFPLGGFFAILVINALIVRLPARKSSPDLFRTSVLLAGSALVLGSLLSGALGITGGLIQKFERASQFQGMNSAVLYGFVPIDDDAWYSDYVNSGLAMLSKYRRPGETIMSLDFTNPFAYGLRVKPARGGATVLQYRTTFDDHHKPSPEWLFGSADLVMYPKAFSDPSLADNLPRIYGPFLNAHFRAVAESGDWCLYRRVEPKDR